MLPPPESLLPGATDSMNILSDPGCWLSFFDGDSKGLDLVGKPSLGTGA